MIACGIYLLLSLSLLLAASGGISSLTSDLDLYNHLVVSVIPGSVSDLAREIEEASRRTEFFDQIGWTPTPFYSFLVLLPVWFFGSDILLWITGVSVGLLSIGSAWAILRRSFPSMPESWCGLAIVLFALNFNFIVDSVGVSTMSVAALFVMAGFVVNDRWKRILLFALAAMTRANFAVAFVSLVFALGLIRPRGAKKLLIDFVPAVIIFFVFYKYFYSTYPGGGLNYLIYASHQGIDYAVSASKIISSRVLNIQDDALTASFGLNGLARLMTDFESLSLITNLVVLKASVTLGFVHEKLFQSEYGIYVAKIWRTLYFVFIALPGFYAASILAFSGSLTRVERAAFLWAFAYLLLNSLLIGDPRYLIGMHLLLIISLLLIIKSVVFSSAYFVRGCQ